ncbi:pentatricopeptide repeat-containing protein At1g08070, chloroplastic-like [Spinacia oleracea]|uniref:Pentatricopeptide repeat-containing protein At1g08070, chloroplastic-like n=1 Tax=Spinacia oleracea TaxID=3562 RepID=A0A9R0INM8_SPIOL|nr:pentatricopeptide repeat-containing protein At1g08070, chloroplastic-like [Spinacia oleracea]
MKLFGVYPVLLNSCFLSPYFLSQKIQLLSTLPRWNTSTSNLHITNPILLSMEQCSSMSELKQIQAQMTRKGLIFHVFPVSRIIAFCAISNHGDMNYARLIFNQIPNPNVYIWNTMIRGYSRAKNPELGLSIFRKMVREEVEMDGRSFVFALKAFGLFSGFREGKSIHCRICKLGFDSSVLVQNGLLHFYSDGGFLGCARKVFDECPVKDVVTWTAMIDGYVQKSNPDEALNLFDLMVCGEIVPNEVTMITVLSACALKRDLDLGRRMHGYIEKFNVKCTLNLINALLDMYVKCGCMMTATRIFEEMKFKDVFSWTSMVNGFAKHGELEMARKYFDEMPVKNVVAWNAMISGYSQNNQPKNALKLFEEMVKEGLIPIDEATLVPAFSACAQSGCLDLGQQIHHHYVVNALIVNRPDQKTGRVGLSSMPIPRDQNPLFRAKSDSLFGTGHDMKINHYVHQNRTELSMSAGNALVDTRPDHKTGLYGFMPGQDMKTNPLSPSGPTLCAQNPLFRAKSSGLFVPTKSVVLSVSVGNALIDMYSKCGRIDIAEDLFNEMPNKDLVTYNSLIVGYSDHGKANLALTLFNKMTDQGIKLDNITFIAILSACSHAGLVSKGKEIFTDMQQKFGLQPKAEHYVCMIDLLGRVGLLEEAYDMIRNMHIEPDEAAWGALLNACRIHGYADFGKYVAEKLIDLNPDDSGTYVVLANLCAKEKRWVDVRNVRSMMREKGVRKTRGHSFIEVEGDFHEFSAADDSHPKSKDIYKMLKDVFVMSNVEEDEARCKVAFI